LKASAIGLVALIAAVAAVVAVLARSFQLGVKIEKLGSGIDDGRSCRCAGTVI
jgi:hypothetical protein